MGTCIRSQEDETACETAPMIVYSNIWWSKEKWKNRLDLSSTLRNWFWFRFLGFSCLISILTTNQPIWRKKPADKEFRPIKLHLDSREIFEKRISRPDELSLIFFQLFRLCFNYLSWTTRNEQWNQVSWNFHRLIWLKFLVYGNSRKMRNHRLTGFEL